MNLAMSLADTLSLEQSLVVHLSPTMFNLVCVGGPVLLTLLAFAVMRRLVACGVFKEHHDVASAMFTTLGTVYGIFLAFIVATTWQYYNTTATNVSNEALYLGMLYGNARAYAPESGDALRKLLRDYRQTVVEKEWTMLAKGEQSSKAEHLMDEITNWYTSYQPRTKTEDAFFNESVHNLNMLKQLRDERIGDAASGLIPLLWVVLFAGALATIGFTFLFNAKNIWVQGIMIGLLTLVITLTLFAIVNLDFPFTGQVAISSDPFASLKMN